MSKSHIIVVYKVQLNSSSSFSSHIIIMYKAQLNSSSASASSSSAKVHIQKLLGQHNDLPMNFQDRAVVPHTIKNV
jgi:hypothetical protein